VLRCRSGDGFPSASEREGDRHESEPHSTSGQLVVSTIPRLHTPGRSRRAAPTDLDATSKRPSTGSSCRRDRLVDEIGHDALRPTVSGLLDRELIWARLTGELRLAAHHQVELRMGFESGLNPLGMKQVVIGQQKDHVTSRLSNPAINRCSGPTIRLRDQPQRNGARRLRRRVAPIIHHDHLIGEQRLLLKTTQCLFEILRPVVRRYDNRDWGSSHEVRLFIGSSVPLGTESGNGAVGHRSTSTDNWTYALPRQTTHSATRKAPRL